MVAKKKAGKKVRSLGAKGISSAKAKSVKGGVGQGGAKNPNLGFRGLDRDLAAAANGVSDPLNAVSVRRARECPSGSVGRGSQGESVFARSARKPSQGDWLPSGWNLRFPWIIGDMFP